MKSKKEIKKLLLENCVDEDGDLDLRELDFSDFDGNVWISEMKVKGDLYQSYQNVEGDLYQDCQKVDGDLYQDCQEVDGDLYQDCQEVKGSLKQNCQEVKGDFITQRLEEDEEYKIDKNGHNTIVKKLRHIN